MKDIEKYSNPALVRQIADHYLGREIPIYYSTRQDKKYMLEHDGKLIHFGQYGYEDYTKHKNLARREAFRRRNHEWAKAEKWSPAWLAYHLLW